MNIAADRPEKITEPRLRMDPISAERYTSTDWFHREWKQMWMRTWQIGGLSGHAPEPGDYMVADLGPESILIIRQDTKVSFAPPVTSCSVCGAAFAAVDSKAGSTRSSFGRAFSRM